MEKDAGRGKKMNRIFQIGDFTFRLICPEEVTPPDNFMLFVRDTAGNSEKTDCNQGMGICDPKDAAPKYTYVIEISEQLPAPTGQPAAQRPDLTVFRNGEYENRLIGVKGMEGYYACYREVSSDRAEITLAKERIGSLNIDPVFSSLFAFERRLVQRGNMILHCAYVEYQREAILFSAPSETGKTTQANLWEKYRGSRTVNGDRALLVNKDGRWKAQGWPVCGTSEVCHNEDFPIRAVVMLSQAQENRAGRLTPGQAYPLLYSQITVNKWNIQDHIRTMDLIEDFLRNVPVLHLGCTISEDAVSCLEEALCNISITADA